MDNPIVISLVVSGIGMLMLFLALVFLYGLMYLMTALIKDRPGVEEKGSMGEGVCGSMGADKQRAMRWRAAVIGVALARVEQERVVPPSVPSIGGEEGGGGVVSAWRVLHHQRQLTLNLRTRRVQ
ncbi:MAG: hypothetical protein ISS49_05225 [Anaerolineae bacterium]|nr:hypothetical protein [Anaerolineae bacterium]